MESHYRHFNEDRTSLKYCLFSPSLPRYSTHVLLSDDSSSYLLTMAPVNRDTSSSKAQDELSNPFIAFRRFADEQMSNLMHGIFGLSSACGSASSSDNYKAQDYQAWLQEARSSQQNREREAEEAGRIMDVYTRAFRDTVQEENRNQNQIRDQPLRCPYRPDDQEVPERHRNEAERSRLISGIHQPSVLLPTSPTEDWVCSAPLAYLYYSPYSPFQLEHHQTLSSRGIDWREAFKDLLAMQTEEKKSLDYGDGEFLSGHDWIRGMIDLAMSKQESANKLFSPPEAAYINHHVLARIRNGKPFGNGFSEQKSTRDEGDDFEDDSNDEPITELDLYKHFLGAQEFSSDEEPSTNPTPQPQSRSSTHLLQDSAPFHKDDSKPSILSTLTTTERKTLQDGTVHTKVVLKKRFSDGREESTETMHTQNPVPEPHYQPPAKAVKDSDSNKGSSEIASTAKKNKGWFWS